MGLFHPSKVELLRFFAWIAKNALAPFRNEGLNVSIAFNDFSLNSSLSSRLYQIAV